MIRKWSTIIENGKKIDILRCWGIGQPLSMVEFEEGFFFSNKSIRIYKNGMLWNSHHAV